MKHNKNIKNAMKVEITFTKDSSVFYYRKDVDLFEKSFWEKVDVSGIERRCKGR